MHVINSHFYNVRRLNPTILNPYRNPLTTCNKQKLSQTRVAIGQAGAPCFLHLRGVDVDTIMEIHAEKYFRLLKTVASNEFESG